MAFTFSLNRFHGSNHDNKCQAPGTAPHPEGSGASNRTAFTDDSTGARRVEWRCDTHFQHPPEPGRR